MSKEVKHTKLFAKRLQAEYDELCKKAVPYKGTALLTQNQDIHLNRLLKSARIQKAILSCITKGTKHALKGFMVRCDYWNEKQCNALNISLNDLVRLKTELIRAKQFFNSLDYFKDWKSHTEQRAEEIHLKEFYTEEEYWSTRILVGEDTVPADQLPYLTRMRLKVEASNSLCNENLARYNELYNVKEDPKYTLIHQLFFDGEYERQTVRMFKSKTQINKLIRNYCNYYNQRFEAEIKESEQFAKQEYDNDRYAEQTKVERQERKAVKAIERDLVKSYYQENSSVRDTSKQTGVSSSKVGRMYKEFNDQGVPKIPPKVEL